MSEHKSLKGKLQQDINDTWNENGILTDYTFFMEKDLRDAVAGLIEELETMRDETIEIMSEMKAEGRINLNNDVIGLNTNTVFAGIIIPLDITGTIQKPETDTTKMTAQILQQNADTFLNTGFDTTNTVIDTIDKIKHNKFIDLLQTPVPNDKSTQGAETTPASQQQNTVGDAVTNVLNILGHNTNASSPENTQKQNSNNNKKEPIKLDETIKNLLNF